MRYSLKLYQPNSGKGVVRELAGPREIRMNWIDLDERLKKLLDCTQCIFAFIFLILMGPVLLIFSWLTVSAPIN
jgi:hypothetical protein